MTAPDRRAGAAAPAPGPSRRLVLLMLVLPIAAAGVARAQGDPAPAHAQAPAQSEQRVQQGRLAQAPDKAASAKPSSSGLPWGIGLAVIGGAVLAWALMRIARPVRAPTEHGGWNH